jgi:fucose permease
MRSLRSKPTHPAWIGVALAFYAFIAIGIAEGGLGVLLPSILTAYNLTPATITLLFLSQMTGYIFAALTSSLLSSRIGLARMLLVAAITLTSTLVIYALTAHWFVMVASGTLLGLGIGLIDAGINTYIAKQHNADLMGVLHAFYGVGALLGPTVATTLLALGLGWRSIYLVFAAFVGVMVAGTLWTVVGDYKPMTMRVASSSTPAGASLHLALRTPTVLMAGLLLLAYVGTEATVGNWAYSVHLSRGTPELVAGYSVSAYWLGLTIGRLSMGRMVKYLGAVRTIDFSLVLVTCGLLAWWLLPSQLLSLPLIGFALAAIFPATIWLMPQRVSASMVPAAIGFVTSVASLGAATIPTAVGWIGDRTGLESIPALIVPLAVLMVVLHGWLVRHAPAKSTT